jgi:hypothetical protein
MTKALANPNLRLALLSLTALAAASCDGYYGNEGGGHHFRGHYGHECDDDDDWDDQSCDTVMNPDAGVSPVDVGSAFPDATPEADAEPSVDRGGSLQDAGTSTSTPDAGPSHTDATVTAEDAAAQDATPQCTSDPDCGHGYICSADGRCVLPACGNLHTEADCLARQDCIPIYAGMHCVDPQGRMCVPGDMNCTCATYSFAVCAAHQ